jgi:indole-3-glycerol phosphate synthase
MVTCYESGGASGISVLTDNKFFGGNNEDLTTARHFSRLPILRKEFIIIEYQIWESRLIGADAVLLIAAILDSDEILRFASLASELGLEVLFEVHTEEEIEKIGPANPRIVGINNRDLESFSVDLATTERLRKLLPHDVVSVSESGIKTREDMLRMQQCGIDAVLVGESVVMDPDPSGKIMELTGVRHDPY